MIYCLCRFVIIDRCVGGVDNVGILEKSCDVRDSWDKIRILFSALSLILAFTATVFGVI